VCGIAGYSVSSGSTIDRRLAAQALLAGIAERGADAVGYAWRDRHAAVHVHKQRGGAAGLLDRIEIADDATEAIVHVRDYTKGRPSIEANNHPIRHGAVVGVHNGIIANDEEIFAEFGFRHAEPGMTVDSEAIFALVDWDRSPRVLERLRGTMATAWLDERRPGELRVARGVGRPLWLGRARHEIFFASTRAALEVVEQTLPLTLRKQEVAEGALLVLRDGRVDDSDRFAPDRSFVERRQLPAVRAPAEGSLCLDRLAALASAY
jgi:glucosamine 6-phosphate synthetase-like amidotransferase/phosphosugar isomerase protein